ncbi:MAG: SelB C-terminal domain-containing protein [Candidatus Aminicenantales bacterium]
MKKKLLTDKDKLLALVQDKDLRGLHEKEAKIYLPVDHTGLLHLSQILEEEGKLKIISFSPLFLLSQESLDYFCEKIVAHLARFHEKHPKERGASIERIKKRFDLSRKILILALKTLVHSGRIREEGETYALSRFTMLPAPREERLLEKLEEMYLKGEFHLVSLKEVEARLHLRPEKLQQMLSLLMERKKIVQGKEGFFLHARWLDELILKIKQTGKTELTVSEFKAMIGLSRKYAIPLLELLDEMGVTRRKGPVREILKV